MTLRIPLLNRRPNRSVCILNSEKKSASSVRDLFGVPSSDRFESRARPLRTVLFCDRTNFDIKFGHETQEPGMLHCLRPKQRRDFPAVPVDRPIWHPHDEESAPRGICERRDARCPAGAVDCVDDLHRLDRGRSSAAESACEDFGSGELGETPQLTTKSWRKNGRTEGMADCLKVLCVDLR